MSNSQSMEDIRTHAIILVQKIVSNYGKEILETLQKKIMKRKENIY